ncbi:hypothetical protein PIB30_070946, partial [Stylosanthes scabra]|nr:hypothetical protein [Stylosanthes scabra]
LCFYTMQVLFDAANLFTKMIRNNPTSASDQVVSTRVGYRSQRRKGINQYNMIRQEQKFLEKEILDVKKHQMNTVTMGSSSNPQKYEPDQALMKIREQHANFSEV